MNNKGLTWVFTFMAMAGQTLIGCQRDPISSSDSEQYFDLSAIVNEQIELLTDLNPEITKQSKLGEDSTLVTLRLDSLGWSEELQIFKEVNINLPAYYGLYTITKSKEDAYSNLFYDDYQADSSSNLAVRSLRIYYLKNLKDIKRIEVSVMEINELFKANRYLEMRLENRRDVVTLNSYRISGNQKLIVGDPTNYFIQAELDF